MKRPSKKASGADHTGGFREAKGVAQVEGAAESMGLRERFQKQKQKQKEKRWSKTDVALPVPAVLLT